MRRGQHRGQARRTSRWARWASIPLVLTALVAVGGSSSTTAAPVEGFNAGHIISDDIFYNSNAMSVAQIQTFINQQGASCQPGEQACLKDYRQDVAGWSADDFCGTPYIGGAQQSAAEIIYRASYACGINPQVVLVMLQKEQGLVTKTRPTTASYTKALGYRCPDTAACDPQYAGFANQVYNAVHRFREYRNQPTRFNHRAGQNNTVRFHPDTNCGSSTVYIQNVATASLYNYTPYQPNKAALDAGRGTGDSCSSYGNRNFYIFFTTWFGPTTLITTSGEIGKLYDSMGGLSSWLGRPTEAMVCGLPGGGCGQNFAGGWIAWSPAAGAVATGGAIRDLWSRGGGQSGWLGYPTESMRCGLPSSGCGQPFQGGWVAYSPATGAVATSGEILRLWSSTGGQSGYLAYPTSAMQCGLKDGGCSQVFQGGTVTWSPGTGTVATGGEIARTWTNGGSQAGWLGYPTADMACGLAQGGCSQQFQGGSVVWSSRTGAVATSGHVQKLWSDMGDTRSWLAYPSGTMRCGLAQDGCSQDFQGGTVTWTRATGAVATGGEIASVWRSGGAQTGWLGYPTAAMQCSLQGGGCSQAFQGGQVVWSGSTGAVPTSGFIAALWIGLGGTGSWLAYPSGTMRCGLVQGGCSQTFQGGIVTWTSTTGAVATGGSIAERWVSEKSQDGRLGYPAGVLSCTTGSCTQVFQRGTITWTSPSTVTVS